MHVLLLLVMCWALESPWGGLYSFCRQAAAARVRHAEHMRAHLVSWTSSSIRAWGWA